MSGLCGEGEGKCEEREREQQEGWPPALWRSAGFFPTGASLGKEHASAVAYHPLPAKFRHPPHAPPRARSTACSSATQHLLQDRTRLLIPHSSVLPRERASRGEENIRNLAARVRPGAGSAAAIDLSEATEIRQPRPFPSTLQGRKRKLGCQATCELVVAVVRRASGHSPPRVNCDRVQGTCSLAFANERDRPTNTKGPKRGGEGTRMRSKEARQEAAPLLEGGEMGESLQQ